MGGTILKNKHDKVEGSLNTYMVGPKKNINISNISNIKISILNIVVLAGYTVSPKS